MWLTCLLMWKGEDMKRLLIRHMFPWLSQKCAGKRFCIRCLEARETEDIPLVKLTPMVLEMGHYDLTGSATQVMLATRCRATVGQKHHPHEGG